MKRRSFLYGGSASAVLALSGCGGGGGSQAVTDVVEVALDKRRKLPRLTPAVPPAPVEPTPTPAIYTFNQEFSDPAAPLLRSKGGPFNPYHTYFGGPAQPDGPPGYRWWDGELHVYATAGYTPAPYNPFKVANGVLSISAEPTPAAYTGAPQRYVSGCLETSNGGFWEAPEVRASRGGHEQKYGYWEIRCRIPKGKGIWAAFWLAGGIMDLANPKQGEIDLFEVIGEPNTIHQTAHDWWANPHKQESLAYKSTFDYSTDFHTYGLLWTATEIVWFVDGVETHRASAALVARYRDLCGPMYLQANIAVGGWWPGAPDSTTVFPAVMDIDFIRVKPV